MDVGFTCAYLDTSFARRITGGTVYADGGTNMLLDWFVVDVAAAGEVFKIFTTLLTETSALFVSLLELRKVGLSSESSSAPTQRGHHSKSISKQGRMHWQKDSGYNRRAKVKTSIDRYTQVIVDGLCFQSDNCWATEVAISFTVMNHTLMLGRKRYVRDA